MQDNLRLFCWCDTPTVYSGFGHVVSHILGGLKDTGAYTMKILGVNYQESQPNPHNYDIVSAWTERDPLGISKIEAEVLAFDPDLIFLFQDIFNTEQVIQKIRNASPRSRVVAYFPLDFAPVPREWLSALSLFDRTITYTQFGKEMIQKIMGTGVDVEVIGHSVDTDIFHPLPEEERKAFRKQKQMWGSDVFGVISVNRFSPRKNIPAMLRAYNLFQTGYKVCPRCGKFSRVGSEKCELNDCEGFAAGDVWKGSPEARLYLHMNPQEPLMGRGEQNSLHAHIRTAGPWGHNPSIGMPDGDIYSANLDYKTLNKYYNAGDVFLTTTYGEGWGLTAMEALAAGTPVIGPRNTALPEATAGDATLVDNVGWVNFPHEGGGWRPLVSVEGVVLELRKAYDAWKANGQKRVAVDAKGVRNLPTWDQIAKKFHRIFQEEAAKGPDFSLYTKKHPQSCAIYWKEAGPSEALQITPALRALSQRHEGIVSIKLSSKIAPILSRDFRLIDTDYEPEGVAVNIDNDRPWRRYMENAKGKPTMSLMELLGRYFRKGLGFFPIAPYIPTYTPDPGVVRALRKQLSHEYPNMNYAGKPIRIGVGWGARMENFWPHVSDFVKLLVEMPGVLPMAISSKKVKMLPDGCFNASIHDSGYDGALSSLALCDILVSTDGYLIDGAAALGLPALALIGPAGAAERLKHYGTWCVTKGWPCQPCWREGIVGCKNRPRMSDDARGPAVSRCMDELDVEEVAAKMSEMLKHLGMVRS